MIIQWLGHASFLLISNDGTKIIMDPYEAGAFGGTFKYRPITISPDIVTVSHHHADHGYVEGLPNHFEVLNEPMNKVIKGIGFKGVGAYHDAEFGASRGKNIIWVVTVNHVRVCHLGDLGHELSPIEIEKVGEVDILLAPVGGTYTLGPKETTRVIDHLHPKITIPMHFKNEHVGFPLLPVDDFLAGKTNVVHLDKSELELTKEQLPDQPQIIVMKPELGG